MIRQLTMLVTGIVLVGCSSGGPPPMSESQKQDAILADPMRYKPEIGRDITGGDITHVGNGIDKDMNDVLNP